MKKIIFIFMMWSGIAFANGGTPHPDPKYCPLCEAARIEKTFETSGESVGFGNEGETGKKQVGNTLEGQTQN